MKILFDSSFKTGGISDMIGCHAGFPIHVGAEAKLVSETQLSISTLHSILVVDNYR